MPLSKITAASAPRSSAAEELDDRVPAGLLLAVAREAHVDRQLPGRGELAGGGQQQVELALVVGDAAAVEVLAADLGLERRRLPQLERIGRLHVEVAVAEDGRRALADRVTARSSPTASGWPCQSSSSASPPAPRMQLAHPFAGARHIIGVRGIGADRLDPQELGELVEPRGHPGDPS